MDDNNEQFCQNKPSTGVQPDSPKPLSFTIDFSNGKAVDTERHKCLIEKYKKRHCRGQSLSKLENTSPSLTANKKRPLTGNLPRKSSFQSDGYYSSDEKCDSSKNSNLVLSLKNKATDKMTQSFPNCNLPSVISPEVELKDISSPELDLVSPYSPNESLQQSIKSQKTKTSSSENSVYECGSEIDIDKSDTVSDAGTYTLDADNYTEEQKARMSIDEEFKIEQVSVQKKTEEYVRSLTKEFMRDNQKTTKKLQNMRISEKRPDTVFLKSPSTPEQQLKYIQSFDQKCTNKTVLSPILSPTQNMSILQSPIQVEKDNLTNGANNDASNKNFSKIMFPSQPNYENQQYKDLGTVISVTSSGAFRTKSDRDKGNVQKINLTKSEIHVETYLDDKIAFKDIATNFTVTTNRGAVQNVTSVADDMGMLKDNNYEKIASLPPAVGGVSGKMTITKIPSPVHSLSRPRSRNSINYIDLSDSSLETESYLKSTQNCINSLQKRLSFDSDHDSDSGKNYNISLNNDARNLIKQKLTHIRHNSFDDRSLRVSNKLEHFQNKNLHRIDQTYSNQYSKTKTMQNNSNSPIRRSSSFSTKNHINIQKNTNDLHKEFNLRNSPNLNRNGSIQRSASSTSIKPNLLQFRRTSDNTEHCKIDRNQFGDTESSSDEDFEQNHTKKKDFSNITNTRYNRAFSLRRARLDVEPAQPLKCPNTPEMRRKFQPERRTERAISVDRKPAKTNEIQSRYLLNINKNKNPASVKQEPPKNSTNKPTTNKSQVFSRTDSGRFSIRSSSKPPAANAQKNVKKDAGKKSSSGRSNSSLSSREVEFQNWKRRKSYDPMKAAAEGKRKAELAKKQNQSNVQSSLETNQNQDCDSSPSHSSSVHRSQSFHGTAALEKLISSEEDDLTLSADEGFSPPTPSPYELSPARATLRQVWRKRL